MRHARIEIASEALLQRTARRGAADAIALVGSTVGVQVGRRAAGDLARVDASVAVAVEREVEFDLGGVHLTVGVAVRAPQERDGRVQHSVVTHDDATVVGDVVGRCAERGLRSDLERDAGQSSRGGRRRAGDGGDARESATERVTRRSRASTSSRTRVRAAGAAGSPPVHRAAANEFSRLPALARQQARPRIGFR